MSDPTLRPAEIRVSVGAGYLQDLGERINQAERERDEMRAKRFRTAVRLWEQREIIGLLEDTIETWREMEHAARTALEEVTRERDDWRATAEAQRSEGLMSALVDELRAILTPLLDHPWQRAPEGRRCVWCGRYQTTSEGDASEHWGGCPTYLRAVLLGRSV